MQKKKLQSKEVAVFKLLLPENFDESTLNVRQKTLLAMTYRDAQKAEFFARELRQQGVDVAVTWERGK